MSHVDGIRIEAASLARAIREQTTVPITAEEAEGLAQALEASEDDEQLMANLVSAVRYIDAACER